MKGISAVVLTVFGLAFSLHACITNPETGRKSLDFVPDSQMNLMGKQAYDEVLQKEKLSTDKRLTDIVVKVGKRIAVASGANFEWDFHLIEKPSEVNAFCLPGGKVAVYTGIIPVALTEAGLAAVLGHEVGHAVARHGAERMSQGIIAQAGLVTAGAIMGDSRYKNAALAALGIGAQVGIMLPFSRKDESEADAMGLKYMARAGYNPEEAVSLWDRMAKLSSGGSTPEILSTHPASAKRAQDLRDQLPAAKEIYEKSEKQPPHNLAS